MATAQLHTLFRVLRRTVAARGHGGLTDAELLERFVARRDEAAFEVLVWRHGPMVWHTCSRALSRAQDVEDAFQATFLALVRQARSIHQREALPGWLHRVAHRVALRVRADAERRARFEKQVEYLPDARAHGANGHDDLRQVLDEEINRLPEKYRLPVILCYLEGKTNAEAARQLECPHGTILSRLARARERLRVRLLRRGITLGGAGLGIAWTSAATASVPAALVQGTVKAALGVAAGKAAAVVVSAHVAALTEGVLHAMLLTKVKLVAGVLLAVAVVGSGLGLATHHSWGLTPAAVAQADPRAAAPTPQGKPRSGQQELDRLRELQAEAEAKKALVQDQLEQAKAQLQQAEERLKTFQLRFAETERKQAAKTDPLQTSGWKLTITLEGHTASVSSVAFAPDGKLLASGGKDEQIRLWDAAGGKLIRHFVGHKGGVTHLAFSPDGKSLASAGGDGVVFLWDVNTGGLLRRLQGNSKVTLRVSFSPDSQVLAVAGVAENHIQLWDVARGQQGSRLAEHGQPVTSVAFAPDGKTLVSTDMGRAARLWDVATGREVRRFQDHDEQWSAAFSADGKSIAAGSKNGTVVLWEAATGKQLTWQQGHRDGVTAVTFTPDGKALISASKDRTILYYPLPAGDPVQVGRHEGPIASVAISSDGKTLASAGEDRVIRIWQVAVTSAAAPAKDAAPAGDRLTRLLKELLDANRSDEQIVEALYLAALTRLPQDGERKDAQKLLAGHADRRRAFEQVIRGLAGAGGK